MSRIELMSPAVLEQMRESCRLAASTLVMVGEHIGAGMTTNDIDVLVHDYIVKNGARPSPLNYKGFPKSVCTSINECVCHGIPEDRELLDGDIINVDVTTYLPEKNGFHGDTSVTYYIGEPSDAAKKVVEVARRSLEAGIGAVKPGGRIRDIGAAIQDYAEAQGCSVVRDFVGHGVGRDFHMAPQVPHYRARGKNPRIKAGMVFTIEPMINLGGFACEILDDDWTVLTADRSLSAQFEHTIAVHRDSVEVLTRRDTLVKRCEDVPWADLGVLTSPAAFD